MFLLYLDFLPVAEGEADVVLGVDGQVVDQPVEDIEGEFRQAVWRVFEGLDEVLISGFPGLSFLDFLAKIVNPGFEFVVPVGEVVVALLVGALVEDRAGVLLDVLLNRVGHDLRLIHEPVALGFEFVGFEEERKHLFAIRDDLRFRGEKLVHR